MQALQSQDMGVAEQLHHHIRCDGPGGYPMPLLRELKAPFRVTSCLGIDACQICKIDAALNLLAFPCRSWRQKSTTLQSS